MGLASALTTALTGMQGAETQVDVAGNNLANSQTVGFKASTAVFATQFLQTQSLGSSPTTSSGPSSGSSSTPVTCRRPHHTTPGRAAIITPRYVGVIRSMRSDIAAHATRIGGEDSRPSRGPPPPHEGAHRRQEKA